MTRSWWRTAPVCSMADAQAGLDAWSVEVADRRVRAGSTVGELGAAEPLRALPALAYPALITVTRKVSRAALVAYAANRYSVPAGLIGQTVTVRARVGGPALEILSPAGLTVAEHRLAPAGAQQTVRTGEHAVLLDSAVLAAFTTSEKPCRRKENRPPGQDALAALARANGVNAEPGSDNVRSLADYQAHADAATQATLTAAGAR